MKIIFINTFDDPSDGGGTEFTLWTLVRGLVAAGHDCVILSTSATSGLHRTQRDGITIWKAGLANIYWPGSKKKRSQAAKIMWHGIDYRNPLMQRHLRRVLEIEKPDIASVHNLPGWSALAWKTIRKHGIPIVQVLHDHYSVCANSAMFSKGINCHTPCGKCLILRNYHAEDSNYVSAVVGVSQYILQRHIELGRFSRVASKHVIHNARDPRPLGIDAESPPRDEVVFGFIGRLDSAKGIENLIDSFTGYPNHKVRLVIGGTGEPDYIEALKNRASDDRILFIGRTNPRDFYPFIDALIVPSLWNEPLGMVVAEAFAFGKPVIGSRRGGIPEMIHHEVNGLLYDPTSKTELVTAIKAMAENSEILSMMSTQAKLSSHPFIDVPSWASRYVSIYQSLLTNKQSA